MRNFEAMLTCRSCGRQRPEAAFTLGVLKCVDCVRRDEFRKGQAMERKAARADWLAGARADSKGQGA
jgi:hypothetical protein